MIEVPIVLYGKPGCQACRISKLKLESAGVPFVYHDVTTDEVADKWVREMGYLGLPVTVDGFEHWQGMDNDRLVKAIESRVSRPVDAMSA